MKTFQTELKPFVQAMTHACRVVERKNTIPILGMVMVSGGLDTLSIQATDLDARFEKSMPAACSDHGDWLLPAHDLLKLCKAAVKDYENVTFKPDKEQCLVEFGDDFSSTFKLDIPYRDFPNDGRSDDYKHTFELSRDDLAEALRLTVPFASTEITRYYLNGVYLDCLDNVGGGVVRFVATDGHRLSAYDQKAHVNGGWPITGPIIPLQALKTLQAMLKTAEAGDVNVLFAGDKLVRFCTSAGDLSIKLIDGTFPDYHRVLPKGNDKVLIFSSRDALLKGIDQVTALSERGRAIKIVGVEGDKIELSCNNPDSGSLCKALAGQRSGNDVPEIGCNGNYLHGIARLAPDDGQITLRINDAGSPILVGIGVDAHQMVLMPMKI